MRKNLISETYIKEIDCTSQFQSAFENRYTWPNKFSGYKGTWTCQISTQKESGDFQISDQFQTYIQGCANNEINDLVTSQLWEVAIHRVRRAFLDVHGKNTFIYGEIDELGTEVLVGGKNEGDKYKIKDNIIVMVHRHIHGKLIKILAHKVFNTNDGYLSEAYSSQYLDPISLQPLGPTRTYQDKFSFIENPELWVLCQRLIRTDGLNGTSPTLESYYFSNLQAL